ncbi:TetR/AcrR family transcriptional regulator [uncultured Zhongshania sp.]|uniref:TetR/AcrR family transcriptional regulator n=1 Tax=uncultured Zhongshania sp. TaxID=1642288 RepID=UPI0025E85DB5|nr:TetR/AcrR family transcriptional regulator [uncultured Zhongshania sp.]
MNKNVRKVGRPSVTSREEILAAAVALLQQEELSALSLRQLAKQLDLSPTSLYRYFESKQQLITALGENLISLDAASLPAGFSSEQRLEALLNQLRRQVLTLPGLLPQFNSALPAEAMVRTIADLAQPIIDMNIERGEAIRHAQSLLWMTLGFALFETSSSTDNIAGLFLDLPAELQATSKHLVLNNHEQLWREVMARNIRGIAALNADI